MAKCTNCGKEFNWWKVNKWKSHDYRGRNFCSSECINEFKNKPQLYKSEIEERKVKEKLLDDLKKQQAERQTELKINGKNPTKADKLREQKIIHLQEELKVPTASKIAGGLAAGGLVGGMALSWTGIIFMLIGGILTITIIGAIIGIPLIIIGFILFIVSGFVAGGGLIGGLIAGIIGALTGKKK